MVSTTAAALLGGGVYFAASASAAGPALVSVTAAPGASSGVEVVTGVVQETSTAGYVRVDYGTTTSYGSNSAVTRIPAGTAQLSVPVTLSNLSPGTAYHYHFVVGDTSANETASADQTFVPISTPSAVGGGPVGTEVIYGQGNPNGVTGYVRVDYGTTSSYGSHSNVVRLGSGTALTYYAVRLTGLTPGATYHFQVAQGDNQANEVDSPDATFVVGAVGATPEVLSTNATAGPPSGTEVVYGQANAHGTVASLRIDYGLSTSYGASKTTVLGTNSLLPVLYGWTLPNLSVNRLYHYRVVAINATTGATTTSGDHTFVPATVAAVPAAKWQVEAVYLHPTDRPYNAAYASAMVGDLWSLPPWFKTQVGTSTFHIAQAAPLDCALPQNAAFYANPVAGQTNSTWNKLVAAAQNCAGFSTSAHIFWDIFADIPQVAPAQTAGQSLSDACNENRLGQTQIAGYTYTTPQAYTMGGDTDIAGLLGVVPITCNYYVDLSGLGHGIGGLAHEMGHGFGLQHANWEPDTPTSPDSCQYQGTTTEDACDALGASVMGWGFASWPNTFISPFDINILKASPFFF